MKYTSVFGFLMCSTGLASAQSMPADYADVLKTLGKQGDFKANVLKINIPRMISRSPSMASLLPPHSALPDGWQ